MKLPSADVFFGEKFCFLFFRPKLSNLVVDRLNSLRYSLKLTPQLWKLIGEQNLLGRLLFHDQFHFICFRMLHSQSQKQVEPRLVLNAIYLEVTLLQSAKSISGRFSTIVVHKICKDTQLKVCIGGCFSRLGCIQKWLHTIIFGRELSEKPFFRTRHDDCL